MHTVRSNAHAFFYNRRLFVYTTVRFCFAIRLERLLDDVTAVIENSSWQVKKWCSVDWKLSIFVYSRGDAKWQRRSENKHF